MTVRLLHTADWQLGRSFASFEGDIAALLRTERFDAVRRIAALATELAADVVLVAGDVFERNDVASEIIARALAAMRGFSGLWILLPGNHDASLAASAWTRLEDLGRPENVIVANRPAPLILLEGRLAVLPAPLAERRVIDDLTAWMDETATPEEAIRVGLAHGSIAAFLPDGVDAPNPIAANRAATAGLDYFALGDWHGTLEVGERCWYSGTPEPDGYKENDPGNVLLVEIAARGARPHVTKHRTAGFTWCQHRLELSAVEERADLERGLEALRRSLGAPHRTVLKLALEGMISLKLAADLDELLKRVQGEVAHLEIDDAGLLPHPSEEELKSLDDGGIIGAAAAALAARVDGKEEPDATAARLALRLLFGERIRVEGRT